MKQMGKSRRLRAAAGLLVLLAAAPLVGNVDPKKGRVTANPTTGNSYSIEQEVQYGRKAIPEIEKELPLLPVDHPVSKYINALGQRLAAQAPGYKFPYTFRVVNQKEINAFALPGGPIYMNTGTIAAATEAELAGVLGHEISHVVMRHSTRQASRQTKAAIPLAILSGVLGAGVGGSAGSLAQMGISVGAGSVFTKYSRDAETEADMVGAQIIYDTGFDPQAMVTFFQKLKEQPGGGRGAQFSGVASRSGQSRQGGCRHSVAIFRPAVLAERRRGIPGREESPFEHRPRHGVGGQRRGAFSTVAQALDKGTGRGGL